MNVRHLAPSILAMSALFVSANRLMNGDRASVGLFMRNTRPGSLNVFFDLVQNVNGREAIATAAELKNLLLGRPGVLGLFSLIKRFRGRRPNIISEEDKSVTIELGHVRIPAQAASVRLYQEIEIRKHAEDVVAPLEEAKLDRLVFRDGRQEIEAVTRDDVEAFKAATQGRVDQLDAEISQALDDPTLKVGLLAVKIMDHRIKQLETNLYDALEELSENIESLRMELSEGDAERQE